MRGSHGGQHDRADVSMTEARLLIAPGRVCLTVNSRPISTYSEAKDQTK